MSNGSNDSLQRYKVRTIYIKIPSFVYDKLLKYKMVYNLDELIVNHLIDKIEEIEARRSGRIQEDLGDINDGVDDESIPELEGMIEKKKRFWR